MATYGKPKKKSLLTSFSVFRNAEATSGSPSTTSSKPDSTDNELFSSQHNDTIDVMASMLLDESSNQQMNILPTKGALSMPKVKVSAVAAKHNSPLRSLPSSSSVVDNSQSINSSSGIAAARSSKTSYFPDEVIEDNVLHKPSSKRPPTQSRETSAPPIPLRSSKRMSSQLLGMAPNFQTSVAVPKALQAVNVEKADNKHRPNAQRQKHAGVPHDIAIAKSKATATASNVPPEIVGEMLHEHLLIPAKERQKDHSLVTKWRSAIKDHLLTRPSKKMHDPARDDPLLHSSSNEDQVLNEDVSTSPFNLTATEIRLNEAHNLKRPKILNLTGHGRGFASRDKPPRRRNRTEDATSITSESPRASRTPTKLHRRDEYDASLESAFNTFQELPIRSRKLKNGSPHHQKVNQSPAKYEVDFDALFSSSPLAQSTPRIRLEPTFEEDGRKTLKNVPSDSLSLFDHDCTNNQQDSDVELPDCEPERGGQHMESAKRKSSQLKESGLGTKKHLSKRVKKHPSPSKAELEVIENALQLYPPFAGSESLVASAEPVSAKFSKTGSNQALSSKDPNSTVRPQEARPCGHKKGRQLPLHLKSMATIQSVVGMSKSRGQKSMIPRRADPSTSNQEPEAQETGPYQSRVDQVEDSLLDIDELQWEQTTYDIGMRRL